MSKQSHKYIIVGAGLAGGCAALAIREYDPKGSILLTGDERHLPYDRPDLSKKLWFGKKKLEEIFLRDEQFYDENKIQVRLGIRIKEVDSGRKIVKDQNGNNYRYEKLLLATGGVPRTLSIPGATVQDACYFRYLDDYLRIRDGAREGKSAVVIGGGFIGSEIAAALNIHQVKVTMIFPEPYLVQRVFPDYLGKAIQQHYLQRGITILNEDEPSSFIRCGGKFVISTAEGKKLESDLLIIGIGISPVTDLAQQAGLKVGNGIVVNEYLQTSDPDIYAAGDNAFFPYQALGQSMRVEHWDNAVNQGKWAGRNMAGAKEKYDYLPYFFSDLFEFGYEAVGEVDSRLETFADWQKENDTGVIYYLKEGTVRGVMLCNVWEKLDVARELIKKGETVRPEGLAGVIR